MKIIYGITKSNFGGAQRYVFDLAQAAKAAGHDVTVMAGGKGMLVEKLREHSIRVISLPHLRRDISLIDELKSFHFIFRTLYEEKPDIFHTNSSKMGGIGNLAARLAGVKRIVFTGHGWAFNESWRPWFQKCIIKFFHWLTILFSHTTICVSEASRRDVAWPLLKRKLVVIHNGLEPFDLLPRVDSRFAVGTIAELHKVKGLDVLLEAWAKFKTRHDGVLEIIGDGEEKVPLIQLSRELGLADSVEFKGDVENARRLLSHFDIFVLPSRSENLPYVLLEAGLAGLPVIASAVGGIPEVIDSGVSGILVPSENVDELLSSLILLQENKDVRERLGATLKARVTSEFSIEKMVSETLAQYAKSS